MSELSDSPIWQVLWNHAEGDELLEYEQFVQRYTDLKADRDRLLRDRGWYEKLWKEHKEKCRGYDCCLNYIEPLEGTL